MSEPLAITVATLVRSLPTTLLAALIAALREPDNAQGKLARQRFVGVVGSELQPVVKTLIDAHQAGEVSGQALVLALETGADLADHYTRAQSVEIVWTGPRSGVSTRQTGQVVREVIRAAQQQLWVVSFTVRDIGELKTTLEQALARGLILRLVMEHKDEPDGSSMAKKTQRALAEIGLSDHPQVISYIWPPFHRKERSWRDQQPYLADSLHAKCLLADQHKVFITSANLTRSGLNDNMELGVLLTGGPHPRALAQHFQQLVEQNVLLALPASG